MSDKIEKIEKDRIKKDSYWVYLESGEKISLYIDSVIKHNLKKGKEITEEQLRDWQREDEAQKSFDAALNYLSYRQRSRKEMMDYLLRKGFSVDAVELALNKLEKYGYIDDLNFAGSWAKARLNNKLMSKRMIAYELYQKGIDRAVVDQVLELVGKDEEEKAVFALAEKYSKRYERYEEKERLYKISQALARRGFDWELIQRACIKLTTIQEEGE